MRNRLFLPLLLSTILLAGCGRKVRTDGYRDLPPSTGAVQEIVAVVDSSLFTENTRAALYQALSPLATGLPQKERRAKLYVIPRGGFSRTYRTMRHLVRVEQADSTGGTNGLNVSRDVYATPQYVFTITAHDEQDAVAQIGQSGAYIEQAIRQNAIDALQERFSRITNTHLKAVSRLGIDISIPNYYHVARSEKDFVWLTMDIARQGVKGSAHILLYRLDPQTAAAAAGDAVALRDTVARRYVQGQAEGSYMQTEKKAVRVGKEKAMLGQTPATFSCGYWRMEGDYMGGPFINYTIIDPADSTVYGADGFVYLPSEEKGAYMLELEAILRTFRLAAHEQEQL